MIAIRFHYGFDYIVANNWYVQTSGLIKHDKLNKLCDLKVIRYSLVVEFQRWWVLKNKLFGQESTGPQGQIFKKFIRVMTVCQKLGLILESEVVQKLSLEKKVFNK